MHGAVKKTSKVSLNKGWHTIGVEHFQDGGGAIMQLVYRGPDTLNNDEEPLSAYYWVQYWYQINLFKKH